MQSHCFLTRQTVIGDCVGWRSAQRELVQTSLAPATQTKARRSRFVCQLDWPTHDPAASDNCSEIGAQPNPCLAESNAPSDKKWIGAEHKGWLGIRAIWAGKARQNGGGPPPGSAVQNWFKI